MPAKSDSHVVDVRFNVHDFHEVSVCVDAGTRVEKLYRFAEELRRSPFPEVREYECTEHGDTIKFTFKIRAGLHSVGTEPVGREKLEVNKRVKDVIRAMSESVCPFPIPRFHPRPKLTVVK